MCFTEPHNTSWYYTMLLHSKLVRQLWCNSEEEPLTEVCLIMWHVKEYTVYLWFPFISMPHYHHPWILHPVHRWFLVALRLLRRNLETEGHVQLIINQPQTQLLLFLALTTQVTRSFLFVGLAVVNLNQCTTWTISELGAAVSMIWFSLWEGLRRLTAARQGGRYLKGL